MSTRSTSQSVDIENKIRQVYAKEATEIVFRRSPEAPFLLQVLGQEKQRHYKSQHAERNRRSQRPVVSRAEQADHDVRDHHAARSTQKQRCKKIAQAQYKRKRRSRQHAGYR